MIVDASVVFLAVIAGVMFGMQIRAPFRWVGAVAGVFITGGVAAAGLLLDAGSPWTGPVFAITASVIAVLVSAHTRRKQPGFAGEAYWQRVLLVLRPRHAHARGERRGG